MTNKDISPVRKSIELLIGLCVIFCLFTFASSSYAAITFVASTTEDGNNDDVTITVPGSAQEDDLLLVQITIRNRSGSDGVTPPVGWIQVGSQLRDDDVLQSLYYRLATSGEAGTGHNFDFDGNENRRYIGGMSVFRGVDTTTPVEDENSRVGMSWSSVTAPSVNVSNAGGMLAAFYTLEAGNEEFFTPVGMTEMYDLEEHNGGSGITSMAAYELRGSAGASGDRVATASKSNDDAIGHLIALREGAGGVFNVDNVHGACGVDDLMIVEYDSTINSDALDTSYYSLSAGSVTSVVQQSDTTVVLSTSGVTAGQAYTLTANGVGSTVDFTGLTGHYFDQRNGSGTKVSQPSGIFTGTEFLRKDAQVNFSWGSGTPTIFPNVSGNNDRFSTRWSGYLVPPLAGNYEFRLRSDDGVRLDLSGTEIINDWSLHGPRYSSTSASQTLDAGQGYEVQMEFFEHTGGAVAQMQWSRDGGSWEAIPASALSSCASTSSGSLSGNLNVDNQFDAYLSIDDNVQGTFLGSGSNWQISEAISSGLNEGQDYYLHIHARDIGGAAGFLGEFSLTGSSHTFENGSASLLTNGSDWRVSTSGWSSYQSASTYGANGVTPWGNRSGVDSSAQWIWSSDNWAHNTNYFTTKISASSSPGYAVSSVHGACGIDNLLVVTYDSTIDSDALDTVYYALSSGTVSSVTQQDDTTVVLQITGIVAGQAYTLTVDGNDHSVDFAGLTGHYFDQRNGSGTKISQPGGLFTGTDFLRKDSQVDFNWGTGTPTVFPSVSGNNERFSVRWNGYIVPAQAGSYEFRMNSDDGVRLDFDGSEIVNDWSLHGPRNSSASAAQALNSGRGYAVQMEFFEHTGGAVARLQWRRDGGSWEAIPGASLNSCAVTDVLPEPVADYRMDEPAWSGSAGDVVDSSASPTNVSSQNGLNTTGTAHLCRASDFDGVDDYIQSSVAGSTLAGTSSMSFWLKTSQVGSNTLWTAPGISGVEQSGGSDDIFWGWIDGSGHIGVSVGNDSSSRSNAVINDNTFHHVVLTRDAITGAYKIYIDGNLDKSGVTGTGIIGTPFDSIGRRERGSNGYFQGQLDEVKIYDRVLNDAQVSELFTETRSCGAYQPLAHYAFEQSAWSGTGVTIEDYSGSGNAGISVGSTESHASGYFCKGSLIPDNGNSATIDAIDSQLDADSDVGNQGTILLWYRSEENWVGSGDRMLMDATTNVFGNANDKYFFLSKLNDGRLRFALEDSSDADFDLYSNVNSVVAGTWVHLGVSWDLSADELQIYVGASSAASSSISSNGSMGDVGNIYFGDNSSTYLTSGASAYGRLDEIKIYDSVLSEAEIATAMGDSHACSSCTLGSFAMTQPANGLACPDTRLAVPIQALCIDGTPKEDYAGTIDLSTNDNASSEFYAASSGGSPITSLSLDGSELGLTTAYLFHERAIDNVLITAEDSAASVSTAASSDTDFSAYGFVASNPGSFTCGASSSMTLTAVGQTQPGSACAKLSDFDGNKMLSASFAVNYQSDELPAIADTARTALSVNSTDLPATNSISANFDQGEATLSLGHLDAGQILSISFEHDDGVAATSDMLGEMSNAFFVSPNAIESTVPSATACSAPYGDCDEFEEVGDDFTQQLRAVCSDTGASTAVSYVSEASTSISLRSNLVAPSSGVNAGVNETSATFSLANNGIVSIAQQQIDEVGVFTLEAFNVPDYGGRSVDGSTSPNVGRFTPSGFGVALTAGSFMPECNSSDPFTYMDQPFQWSPAAVPELTITALRADGISVAQNYEGDFWKLGSDLKLDESCGGSTNDKGYCYTNNTASGATLTSPGLLDTVSYGTPENGTVSVDIHPAFFFSYDRPAGTNITPFPVSIALDISLEDEDGKDGLVNLSPIVFLFAAEMRQGRWKMENAYGPDTQELKMKAYPQYYSSAGNFIAHGADLCTSVTPTVTPLGSGGTSLEDITVGTATTTLSVNAPLNDTQNENFSFSAPGVGGAGSIQVNQDLSAIPWLRFDWDGDGALDSEHPFVEAQFGQYRGHDRIIYWREVSN